jgi:arylsulfatase
MPITRRQALATLLAAPLARRRPNIILIITDDQGYADLGCHGNPVIQTPHLDRIHGESARFTDFHVSPTCSPTRSAVMSGRHEFKNGITHTILERERMALSTTTIAQVLKSAGYQTGIFGKWHLGDSEPYRPEKRGFDEVFIHGCGGIGQKYEGTCADAPGNSYFDPAILHNGRFEKTKGYCTDVFFGQAIQWIGAQRRPFFAYITPNAPHAPLECPPGYEARYAGQGLDQMTQKYFGMITNIDDNVGRLVARLKEKKLERDTLLIFMNDNGGTVGVKLFNAGMRGQKGTPYQGGTRAAAFFRWPGTLTPGDRLGLAAHIDLYPTLAELAGAKLPQGYTPDGRSLTPLLENARAPWPDRYLFTHVGRWNKGQAAAAQHQRCRVRNTRYSLVNQGARWELYDLARDPGEKQDLAGERPEVVREMSAVYDRWWEEVRPLLVNEEAVPPARNPFHELWEKQFGRLPERVPR